jgi:PAS domain S-box-containing protein
MRERFHLDRERKILFIDLARLKIESREQVDEMARLVYEAFQQQGGRIYAVVNYEGTEIAPEIIDYYGERIKRLHDLYGLATVRYSSSGLTRSVLRYLGAAQDLESNIFATREEAIRAIEEMAIRSQAVTRSSVWRLINPRRSIFGKLLLASLLIVAVLLGGYGFAQALKLAPEQLGMMRIATGAAILGALAAMLVAGLILSRAVLQPLQRMQRLAHRLIAGTVFEPVQTRSRDEIGQLVRAFNEAGLHLRQEIERLSGLYHISLMMGTGTEVSKICQLLTRKVARLLRAEMCLILLYDERERSLQAQLPAYGVSDEHLRLLRAPLDEQNLAAQVFKTGEAYLTNQAQTDPLISSSARELLGVRTMLAVPLLAGNRALGTLEVMNKQGGFLEEDKRLATIFASQAAHLLFQAQLFEQLRESEERYRQIFESALDGLYRSTTDGQLVTVNPALVKMLGYRRPEELLGANLMHDLLMDQTAARQLREELAACGQALDVECKLRRRSGEAVSARLSVRVVTDQANQESYHLGIVKDITEQKRLAEQLILSERLAAVGELVAGVAHEVRNPLFGITTTLSALSRRLSDRETVQPYLEVVKVEAERLNYLMEQLLEHSRPIWLDEEPADLGNVIRDAMDQFSEQARQRGVTLTFDCPAGVPSLRFDRRKMHGVFINLLDNALQHTQAGGQVRIAIESLPNSSAAREPQELQITISDTGTGIPTENLSRVFDPFFTTRARGTGLGLAITRKTIHDHGGTITVHSEMERGTTFTIRLPAGGRMKEECCS